MLISIFRSEFWFLFSNDYFQNLIRHLGITVSDSKFWNFVSLVLYDSVISGTLTRTSKWGKYCNPLIQVSVLIFFLLLVLQKMIKYTSYIAVNRIFMSSVLNSTWQNFIKVNYIFRINGTLQVHQNQARRKGWQPEERVKHVRSCCYIGEVMTSCRWWRRIRQGHDIVWGVRMNKEREEGKSMAELSRKVWCKCCTNKSWSR